MTRQYHERDPWETIPDNIQEGIIQRQLLRKTREDNVAVPFGVDASLT